LAVAVVAIVLTWSSGAKRPPPRTETESGLHRTVVARDDRGSGIPPATLVATLLRDAPSYSAPGGPTTGTVASTWFGRPSVLPVLAQQTGYLHVRVPQRPNGSTAWIRAKDAELGSTAFHIEIHLSTRHLDLYEAGKLVLKAPAGIGTTRDPTPTGHFFVAFIAAPPSAGYGPFVIVTSGHSNAISDWEQSGDALMAIHGPLAADGAIGTTGAAVSHGCVRLHLGDLERLRSVPLGSPIDVIN
jgi:hypothetical protein